MSTIWIIGDSTVEDNKLPFRGWGFPMRELAAAGVSVCNHGLSGRSTRSFLNEGLFEPVREGMQAGDVLLIQFGHNDEKEAADLHTDPDTTYCEFLTGYCDAARTKGALPVLVTPVSRRFFIMPHEMLYTHGEYPAAMRKLAAQLDVPLVDLKAASRALYLELGEEKTAELFVRLAPGENADFPNGHDDKTHFNETGAATIARLVSAEMKKDPRTAKYVK